MNYRYSPNLKYKLKYQFKKVDNIETNYSDLHQDMFVLSVLNGLEHGTYLEIGCQDPVIINNTFLLETVYSWKGVSIDISQSYVNKFNNSRKNLAVCLDATSADYDNLLSGQNLGPIIDYLSCDCEPPINTFKSLKKIPHDKFKFRVITFEHDFYNHQGHDWVREESRNFLSSLGYYLVVNDISSCNNPIEDWWIHPDLVDMNLVKQFTEVDDKIKNHQSYIYK